MEEAVAESPAGPAGLSLSVDGRLAYAADTGYGRAVYVTRLREPATSPIAENATQPAMTPDGRTVLFRRTQDGGIWRANVDGSDVRRVIEGRIGHGPILVAPDFTRFVFTRFDEPAATRVLEIASLAGGNSHVLATAPTMSATWPPFVSPDGRRVRFFFTERDKGVVVECDLPDCSNTRRDPPLGGTGPGLAWTPDGKLIAFVERDDSANVTIRPVSGGAARRLTSFKDQEITALAWSPDGKRLILNRRVVLPDIVLVKGVR